MESFKENAERIVEKHRKELEKITTDYRQRNKEESERRDRINTEYHKKDEFLMAEWRQYLYKYILLLGGILSFLIALLSANLIKKEINTEEFLLAIRYVFLALILSILAISYSIFKERENMWGRLYINSINHTEFDRKVRRRSRIKKFFWVFLPFWFEDMEEMSNEQKRRAEKENGWKFDYFSDFKRRHTDYRVFKYGYGLNDGVVWYGRIFGLLSIFSIILGIIGIYRLLVLLSH